MNDMNLIPMRKCSVCGKEFVISPSWVYKTKDKQGKYRRHQCSYTCWRKAGGGQDVKRKYARREK